MPLIEGALGGPFVGVAVVIADQSDVVPPSVAMCRAARRRPAPSPRGNTDRRARGHINAYSLLPLLAQPASVT
jgi:hypothetical protein